MLSGQNTFGIVTKINDDALAAQFFNRSADQVINSRLIHFNDLSALGFPHFLYDYLLRGLGCNTTKLHRFNLLFQDIAQLRIGLDFLGLPHTVLGRGIGLFFLFEVVKIYNRPSTECLVFTRLTIDGHSKFRFFAVFFLRCHSQCGFHGAKNNILWHPFFVGYGLDHREYFFTHALNLPQSNTGTIRAF